MSYGGELIWAVGYTSGGAPYGLSADQMRQVEEEEDREMAKRFEQAGSTPAWFEVRTLLETTFRALLTPRTSVTVGHSTPLGRGLSRRQFAAKVDLSPDPARLSDTYVVGLPLAGADRRLEERAATELAILERLATLALSFRVPRVIRSEMGAACTASIRTFVPGIELDLRAGRQTRVKPWLVVGELAAAVHQLPTELLRGCLPGCASREDFAARQVESLDRGRDHPDVARAIAWARVSKPAAGAATVIHGDLLGQNILLSPAEAPALIDWEYCMVGDPAYDLAIVTRSARRPFQIDRGLDRLLEAYRNAGGALIAARDVHFYEVCIAAGWVCDAMASGDEAKTKHAAGPLQSLLRRVGAA